MVLVVELATQKAQELIVGERVSVLASTLFGEAVLESLTFVSVQ